MPSVQGTTGNLYKSGNIFLLYFLLFKKNNQICASKINFSIIFARTNSIEYYCYIANY